MAEPPASLSSETASKPEMAHVLFTDVVGYSQTSSEEQPRLLQRLRHAVRNSAEYNRAHEKGSLISLATGDGVALVFFDSDVCAPVRAALQISSALRNGDGVPVRMGIHTGLVYRVRDINGAENVSGAGINFAQRVMDCGDAGHILMSQVHASFLCEFDAMRSHLHDLGDAEVKHGVRLHLVSYYDGNAGQPFAPRKLAGATAAPGTAGSTPAAGIRVALVYKRNVDPDAALLTSLESELRKRGCAVFVDRHLQVGLDWAREIERALREADAVIPLLSPASVTSEMLAFELEIADAAAQQQDGKPRILPVRVNWEGPLPAHLTNLLDSIQYTLWRGASDTEAVVNELVSALTEKPASVVRQSRALEPPGGAMPLDSRYYIERPTDAEFHAAIGRGDSIVLVEGARQMGKTSLLSRGLQRARTAGTKVTCIDFQKLNVSDLESLEAFFFTLGTALANQLDLAKFPEDTWRAKSGPNQNFETYVRREVLGGVAGNLVWALDEVDRLFTCPFGSEVFGLFRSWHNARALDPESPWRKLTMVICYATEAHLFITDLNQSPFNVGTRVRLHDFNIEQVRRLNTLYGGPLTNADLPVFMRQLGGQPYLVRRGLHEMVTKSIGFDQLTATATSEQGPFADHLKRFLMLLAGNDAAVEFLRTLLAGKRPADSRMFHRLRGAGILKGETAADAQFRCDLYSDYLRRHLA